MHTSLGKQTPSRFLAANWALPLSAAFLVALGLSTLAGCGGSTSQPSAITISGPASKTIDPGNSASFTATVTGGPLNSGVGWTLTNCSVSACGMLSNQTTTSVTYTAPATVTTAFTVSLTASAVAMASVTASATLSVPANPAITTPAGALPGATYGAAYTTTLAATGGITPYTWSITQGALPSGLSINSSTGAITGSSSSAGTSSFTVTLTDSGNPALTASSAFTITTVNPMLAVTTTSIPHGTEGTAYSATLMATGGSGTGYTWSVTSGTALSAVGLTLSPSGAITGTPTAGETAAPFTVEVTDSASNTATANLTLTVGAVAFQGQVLSGTTPVNGATIQLYAAGSTGNASTAIPMLTQPVISDSLGMFQLNGNYTCGKGSISDDPIPATAQLYLVATGGTTSTTSTTSNPALTMVAAVGPCSNLTAFDTINELTTAAAAWALAPFASSATNLGATSTNTLGLTNAFLDAALLANPATGAPATLPTNLTVETAKLSALANVLNTCTTGTGTGCSALFTAATPPSGAAPTDTFTAALNITHHPGQNVAAIFAIVPTTPPFAATLTASPNDWTMSLTVTGGGLSYPTALGIDSQNNIWVADEPGPLSAFNPQGTPLSATGFGAGTISQVFGLAIDTSNNIWVTNQQDLDTSGSGFVTKFFGVNDPDTLGTSPGNYGSVNFPVSIAADTNGNIYTANTQISSVTVFDGTGNVLSPYLGQDANLAAGSNAVAIDTSHGFWISNNQFDVAHFSSNGTLLANVFCCNDSLGIATDSAGNLWIADNTGGANGEGAVAEAVTDSSGNTTVPITGLTTGGINYPLAVAVDAAQNVWFTNSFKGSITELAGINNTLPVGTAISPSAGVNTLGGYGLDAMLGTPYSLLPDRSGNLWVSNEGFDTVTMFFGLAAPTVTPLQPIPTAP